MILGEILSEIFGFAKRLWFGSMWVQGEFDWRSRRVCRSQALNPNFDPRKHRPHKPLQACVTIRVQRLGLRFLEALHTLNSPPVVSFNLGDVKGLGDFKYSSIPESIPKCPKPASTPYTANPKP